MAKSNVINFKDRRKKQQTEKTAGDKVFETLKQTAVPHEIGDFAAHTNDPVINLEERREEKKAIERRAVTRTVLSQFLGVFVVLPDKGLQPVVLHDVSESGLAFDLPMEFGSYNIGEIVTVRIYLSHDTYFSFAVKVVNRRVTGNEGVMRHGAVFRKNDVSFKTLFYFTKFLENVSHIAKKDSGDRVMGKVD